MKTGITIKSENLEKLIRSINAVDIGEDNFDVLCYGQYLIVDTQEINNSEISKIKIFKSNGYSNGYAKGDFSKHKLIINEDSIYLDDPMRICKNQKLSVNDDFFKGKIYKVPILFNLTSAGYKI